MSAPTLAPAPISAPAPAKLPAVAAPSLTPTRAGLAGAAVGLGAGLLFAELVVPAVIIAAIGAVGLSAWRGETKPAKAS